MNTETLIPPRPTARDVIDASANRIAEILAKWISQAGDSTEASACLPEARILAENPNADGYDLCRQLDSRFGYSPDSMLVEELDNVGGIIRSETRKAINRWALDNQIACPFEQGAEVVLKKPLRHAGVSGIVSKIDRDYAEILVRCESLGHVAQGTGSHGFVVNFEDATQP